MFHVRADLPSPSDVYRMGQFQPPIEKMPFSKSIKVANLAKYENLSNAKKTTKDEIQNAVDKNDFFGLVEARRAHIAYEYNNEITPDIELRHAFTQAFAKLQSNFRVQKKTAENEGKTPFADFSKEERTALLNFTQDGVGGETVRNYAKIPLDNILEAAKYPTQMMSLANGEVRVEVGKLIPGEGVILTEKRAENVLGRDSKNELNKLNLKIEDGLLLSEREESKNELLQATFKTAEAATETIRTALTKLELPLPEGDKVRIFTYAQQGAGKTKFLETFLGLSETTFNSADALKKELGGDIAHHESVNLAGRLRKMAEVLPFGGTIKTNLNTAFDFKPMTEPKPDTAHIIVDIDVKQETVKTRAAERERQLDEKTVSEEYQKAVKGRPNVMQAATQNNKLFYILFNNDGEFKRVAQIVNGTQTVFDQTLFDNTLGIARAQPEHPILRVDMVRNVKG